MHIFLGADHGGMVVKEAVKAQLGKRATLEVEDLGAFTVDPVDDYPDIAGKVASKVHQTPGSLGVLVCGSAEGVCMVANRFAGVRAGVGYSVAAAKAMRNDEDANVLCLPGRLATVDDVFAIAEAFLGTAFSGEERHVRRLNKFD